MTEQQNTKRQRLRIKGRLAALCQKKPLFSALLITLGSACCIAIGFGVLSLSSFKEPILTTAITASTQSFLFVTPDGRQSAWSLPPGQFSIVGTTDSNGCTTRRFESLCEYDSNTRLVVEGTAEIAMQVSPIGGWLMSVAEAKGKPIDVSLYDANDKLLIRSEQFLQFHASAAGHSIRMPFVADSAVLGADLHQSSTIDGSKYDFWQPVLTSGDVVMIADNRPGREKYQVLNERLDPGDVLHINKDAVEGAMKGPNVIWGMMTVDRGGNNLSSLHVVLHSSAREVSVSRFGAPEGHVIRASTWTILQKWPNGQSVWVLFVTLTFLFSFVLGLADRFSKKIAEANPPPNQDRSEFEQLPSSGEK